MKNTDKMEEYAGEDFDWDAPDIYEDMRALLIALQPSLRRGATVLGNFRTCRLPKCRRSKRCTGRHPMERLAIESDHWSNFPPCVDTDEKQAALVAENRQRLAEMEAALRAQGIDPETY